MEIIIRHEITAIHSMKPMKTFRCAHCETKFSTNKWSRTRRGYSASCPCCPYSAWTHR